MGACVPIFFQRPLPIIASTPGLSLPSKVSFRTYRSSNTKGSEEEPEPSKILLHSSSHPTIDYTAQEESSSHETLLNHYVGIYDPARGELKLVPARGAIVRRTLRAQDASGVKEGDEDPSSNVIPTLYPYTLNIGLITPSSPSPLVPL